MVYLVLETIVNVLYLLIICVIVCSILIYGGSLCIVILIISRVDGWDGLNGRRNGGGG